MKCALLYRYPCVHVNHVVVCTCVRIRCVVIVFRFVRAHTLIDRDGKSALIRLLNRLRLMPAYRCIIITYVKYMHSFEAARPCAAC